MDKYKLLEKLTNSKGYDIALFSTFNFDIKFFDRAISRPLIDKGIKKISVFVDQSELNKAVQNIDVSDLGKKYSLNPIDLKGKAFHPKLFLLLGKSSAKLFVASANLTISGYCINHEVVNCFEYIEGNTDNLGIIKTAIDFFVDLHNSSYKQDEELINEIKRLPYYKANVTSADVQLLHNLETPILTQISDIVTYVEKIDIAVPYYDNELIALKEIVKIYPNAKTTLYLQNTKSRIDITGVPDNISTYMYCDISGKSNFYHGKVFRFSGADNDYIMYGSANCTKSALMKTPATEGNIESSILIKGAKCEFDYFFEAFDKIEIDKPDCIPLRYENKSDSNFFFHYGTLTSSLTLVYGFKNRPTTLTAKFCGNDLLYEFVDNTIVIKIPNDMVAEKDNIVDISFEYDGKIEIVKSWYNDTELISFNRAKAKNGSVFNFKVGSDGSEFINDRREILSWTAITLEELLDEQMVYSTMNQGNDDVTEDDIDPESDEEGIINYIIPTSDISDRYEKYKHAKYCSALLIDSYFRRTDHGINTSTEHTVNATVSTRTIPTQSERNSFARFVKLRVNSMFIPEFINKVSFERYWSGLHIFFNIFDKRNKETRKNDIFSDEYIAVTKAKLLSVLLDFEIDDAYTEDVKAIVYRSFTECFFLIDMYSDENYEIKKLYRNMIRTLNTLYDMRDNFKDYIAEASPFIPTRVKNRELEEIVKYADKLFGYIPLDRIYKNIYKVHGVNCVIETSSNKLLIQAGANDIKLFMNPSALNKYLLPLSEYAKYKGGISKVVINISNLATYTKHLNYATTIVYKVDLLKKSYTKDLLRRSGNWDKQESGHL